MASAVQGLAEIVLMVKDISTSLAFYRDILGLEVISPPTMKSVCFLRAGPQREGVPPQIVLVQRPPDAADLPADRRLRSVHHVGLAISAADIEAERTRLAAAGFTLRTGTHPFLPVDAIYLDDPDGNEVELVAWTGS